MRVPLTVAMWTVLAVTGAGCSSSQEEVRCAPDPGLEAEYKVVKCVMDGACVGMAPHPSCPASPGEAPSLCALHGGGFRASRVPCGSNVVVWWSGGTQGFTCLYDQQGALIGTGAAIDSPSYCGGNATWRWGTEIPRSCVQLSDPNLCTP